MLMTDHIISIKLTALLLMLAVMIGAGQNQTFDGLTVTDDRTMDLR
ncbi:MAG: hypothetical protein V3W37_07390 [Candidatus Binatia bacterium]